MTRLDRPTEEALVWAVRSGDCSEVPAVFLEDGELSYVSRLLALALIDLAALHEKVARARGAMAA